MPKQNQADEYGEDPRPSQARILEIEERLIHAEEVVRVAGEQGGTPDSWLWHYARDVRQFWTALKDLSDEVTDLRKRLWIRGGM